MTNQDKIMKGLHEAVPNTLHYDNNLYLRALTFQNKFEELFKLLSSLSLIQSLIKQLKFASVRKGLFYGKTTDQVISILDQSYSSLRIIYMTVIIKIVSHNSINIECRT
jgi:hypothetical protein